MFQQGERHNLERASVRGGERDRGRDFRGESFLPPGGADAPAIAGLQPRKIVVGHRRGEIVAGCEAEREELGGDFDADGVAAAILGAGVALAVAEEAGERID